ncbi:siderophore-interacting protein [Psychromicrobium sp. YIM B11713]|uniref:siderophore-interacting protein n=1 Tax=Psychromicrobium sp. YIM B11713 TaxID=3145233 RepID=UPI00374F19F6
MPATSPAKSRQHIALEVLRTEWLSEHMVRVVLGGEGFDAFQDNGFTDRYVKLHFLLPEVEYPEPIDVFGLRETLPREHWPVTRTYTVRWINQQDKELAIDFVVHGDEGLAGPWAASAQPGDRLLLSGPGGAYRPQPEADWYLLAGDESALPAVAAALEALPADATGLAYLEVGSEADIQTIQAPAGMSVNWLTRGEVPAGASSLLIDAVATSSWPEGTVDAFVHGEREYMKALRDVLFKQRGLLRSQVSLSGYWARGRTEDTFQAEKREPIGKIL